MHVMRLVFSVVISASCVCTSDASTEVLRRSFAGICLAAAKQGARTFTSSTVLARSFAAGQTGMRYWQKPPIKRKEYVPSSPSRQEVFLTSITQKKWEAVEQMLAAGIAVQEADHDGRTPLVLAIIQQAPFELIKKLLVSGAASTIRQKDKHGFDAYVYALNYVPDRIRLAKTLDAVETAHNTGKLAIMLSQPDSTVGIDDGSQEQTTLGQILAVAGLNDDDMPLD